MKDAQGLVALCNVGITIRSDVDEDGTRDREDDNMDDYDGDTILNEADNCPLVSCPIYHILNLILALFYLKKELKKMCKIIINKY